ncbi:MAG TPA: hypothetical protein VGF56_09310 [Rhizomicrobium sp.]|jgi:hypothetical protein
MLIALILAAATAAPVPPDVEVCMRAAAAATRATVVDTDQSGCVCTVQQLHKFLTPQDYALHERMEEIIASGADEKSFNKQLSDIMLKRGMTQIDANAFLARVRSAEERASSACNSSPLLDR